MPLEIRWLIQPAATACYAASLLDGRTPLESPLAAALRAPGEALRTACGRHDLDFRRLLDHLAFHAAENVLPGELTLLALNQTAGPRGVRHRDELAPLVAALLHALATSEPKLADELELRAGPLREQWEARGPGLVKQLARLTEPDVMVDRASVLPVYPVEGGGGRSLIAYNAVVFEAVLANPRWELPEVVRLGWLLAQLNFDLSRYRAGLVDAERVLPLAMIPPVLAAAAEVELVRFEPSSFALALSHWRPREEHQPGTVEVLAAWWQTYLDTRPPWTGALAGLETMLTSNLAK